MNRLALAALVIQLGAAPPTPAPDIPVRSVSLGYVGVTFRVLGATDGNPIMGVVISTSDPVHHSLGCLDPAKILKFQLVNAAGETVPIHLTGLTFGPQSCSECGVPRGLDANGRLLPTPDPCAHVTGIGELRARLRDAYPEVPHGLYTLRVTLSLPGMAAEAEFAPVTIRL